MDNITSSISSILKTTIDSLNKYKIGFNNKDFFLTDDSSLYEFFIEQVSKLYKNLNKSNESNESNEYLLKQKENKEIIILLFEINSILKFLNNSYNYDEEDDIVYYNNLIIILNFLQIKLEKLKNNSNLEINKKLDLKNIDETIKQVKKTIKELKITIDELKKDRNLSSKGGKKSKKLPKKEIQGKMRCIYKIPGDRNEYLKHKGKLITIKEYKELMKAKPKKVKKTKSKK